MPVIYQNFVSGTTTDNPLLIGATTVNGTALADMVAVTGSDTMWLVLDPDGANGAPEIVQVTAHTASATSATITRAQQGTTAREHPSGTVFRVAATKSDLDELPFRKMTTTGDILYASAANVAARLAVGATGTVLHGGTTPSYSAVVAADLATDAVETAKIKDLNVTTGKLAADAVTTVKILDANVTTAKLAADAVTTAKILDANVTTAKLADGAATYAKQYVTQVRLTKTGTCGTSEADVTGMTETVDTDGLASSDVITLATTGWYSISTLLTTHASTAAGVNLACHIDGDAEGSLTVQNSSGAATRRASVSCYLPSATTIKLVNIAFSAPDAALSHTYQLNVLRLA